MSEPFQGALRDKHFAYRVRSVWIKPADYVTGATLSSGGASTLTCGYASSGAIAPLLIQLNGGRVAAAFIRTVGASLSYVWRPQDLDNRHPIYVRHLWTSDSALANVATFNTMFAVLGVGGVPATPTTSLTARIVTTAKGATAHSLALTRLGAIVGTATGAAAGQTFTSNLEAINFNFAVSSLTNGTLTTDGVYILGTEILYTPRQTVGDGSGVQAVINDVPLSTMAVSPTLDFKQR